MWVSKKKWEEMEKKIADLEIAVRGQSYMTNLTYEFCKSVANKDKMSFVSYQKKYSPSIDSSQNVNVLLDEFRKYLKDTFG